MDYPDEEDLYEMMHADELDAMREMEEAFSPPPSANKLPAPKSKRSLDFRGEANDSEPSTSSSSLAVKIPRNGKSPSTVARTFGTSPNVLLIDDEMSVGCSPLPSGNKRNIVRDLFGDIDDIIDLDIERKLKKPKLDHVKIEDRQEEMIKLVLQERNKNKKEHGKSNMAAQEKRERKLDEIMTKGAVPKWPFMPVATDNNQRIYLRVYSEEEFQKKVNDVNAYSKVTGLLDTSFQELRSLALKKLVEDSERENLEASKENRLSHDHHKELWVERYKPKCYAHLLSDETTNRALLHWLKLWDKVVFNREPAVLKKDVDFNANKKKLLDEFERPINKVALLCGPPGLGKTTLSHTIAKLAGYNVVEVNASDDRSAQNFKIRLEAATQMKSVFGQDPKPNCLILDEIDGAPQAAIDVLIKFVTDKFKSKKKQTNEILKRPIICICNDAYVPALRSLRQIAYTLTFPPTSSVRLGERLVQISKMEKMTTDLGTMMALGEKTNNDIRSCLSILHCFKSQGTRVTLSQINAKSMGVKDTQLGLFSVWQIIFHIKLSKKKDRTSLNLADSLLQDRIKLVQRTVQSYGDYDRLASGVYENYLRLLPSNASLTNVVKGLNWFCFHNEMTAAINSTQNYSLYPYLIYPFIEWHLLYSSFTWPKLEYPSTAYEMYQRTIRSTQILELLLTGISAQIRPYQEKQKLLLDVIPYLLELVVPNVRQISSQLHTSKEKSEVGRVVQVMVDYSLNYTQERTMDGSYVYLIDPNLEEVGCFGERPRERNFGYTGKQMLAREVESEKINRVAKKLQGTRLSSEEGVKKATPVQPVAQRTPSETAKIKTNAALPNHLRKLTPKAVKKKTETVLKDFFGRPVEKSLTNDKMIGKETDDIVKSDIWFHFKEGYNNAVRKNVYMSDLF